MLKIPFCIVQLFNYAKWTKSPDFVHYGDLTGQNLRFCNDTKVSYYGNANNTHLVSRPKSPYFKAYYCPIDALYH